MPISDVLITKLRTISTGYMQDSCTIKRMGATTRTAQGAPIPGSLTTIATTICGWGQGKLGSQEGEVGEQRGQRGVIPVSLPVTVDVRAQDVLTYLTVDYTVIFAPATGALDTERIVTVHRA